MTIAINLYCYQISTLFLYGKYTTVMIKTNNKKKKTEQKAYLYGKFGVQNFRVSSWKMMTLCYSVS